MKHANQLIKLVAVLTTISPAELKALNLLTSPRKHQNWMPILNDVDPAVLVEATIEIIDYAEESYKAAQKLNKLQPVPVNAPHLMLELGL